MEREREENIINLCFINLMIKAQNNESKCLENSNEKLENGRRKKGFFIGIIK